MIKEYTAKVITIWYFLWKNPQRLMFVVWPDIGINVSSMLLRCEQGHTTFFLINMYLICQFKHVPRINLVHVHDCCKQNILAVIPKGFVFNQLEGKSCIFYYYKWKMFWHQCVLIFFEIIFYLKGCVFL